MSSVWREEDVAGGILRQDDPATNGRRAESSLCPRRSACSSPTTRLVRTGFRVILEPEVRHRGGGRGRPSDPPGRLVEPDGVILMDIRMPELDGLSAAEEILRHPDPPTIVVLTTFDQNEYVYRALQAGAAGFLLKDAPATRLIAAVRAAATGDSSSSRPSPDGWSNASLSPRSPRGPRGSWRP